MNGIKSMIGKVGEAVSSVADKIRSFLHFSVPDEGPLTDYESWMPDFIGGLAKGIEKSRGMIEQAVQGVAGDMMITPRVMTAQSGYVGSAASNGDLLSGINTALNTALASRFPRRTGKRSAWRSKPMTTWFGLRKRSMVLRRSAMRMTL